MYHRWQLLPHSIAKKSLKSIAEIKCPNFTFFKVLIWERERKTPVCCLALHVFIGDSRMCPDLGWNLRLGISGWLSHQLSYLARTMPTFVHVPQLPYCIWRKVQISSAPSTGYYKYHFNLPILIQGQNHNSVCYPFLRILEEGSRMRTVWL